MSLDKQREARVRWLEENMPAESIDPPFPYIAAIHVRAPDISLGVIKSPLGFRPIFFEAHSSIAGLPESLRIDL